MASISDLQLRVVRDLGDAHVQIDYEIAWDSYDQASNQLYQEHWELSGDDTRRAAQDGPDQRLAGRGALEIVRFAADGQPATHRHLAFTIPLAELFDGGNEAGGVRAVVTLTPVGPFGDSVRSERLPLNQPDGDE